MDHAVSLPATPSRQGLRMGFLDAPRTLFLGDGARHNWELQQTHFPGAIPILDYYHAAEHLADYCKLLPATLRDAVERTLVHDDVGRRGAADDPRDEAFTGQGHRY